MGSGPPGPVPIYSAGSIARRSMASQQPEGCQHLIRALEEGGELAQRLYTTCERQGRAQEARAYNGLVIDWPELTRLAAGRGEGEQLRLLEQGVGRRQSDGGDGGR